MGGRRDLQPPRHRRPGRGGHRSALRWPGQAGGAGPCPGRGRSRRRPRRRQRPADPRRAHQPPRHRRHRLARGSPRRSPRRADPRHPRPPRPRPAHHADPRARPGQVVRARGRVRVVPRGSLRTRGAGGHRGVGPQEPGQEGAGVAAPRRSGADRQAQGPHPIGHGDRRRPGRGPARRGELPLHVETPRLGDQVIELHGVGHQFGADARGCSAASTCCSTPGSGSASSVPTAPASRRCSRCMAGRIEPAEGRVVVGSTVELAVWDQRGRRPRSEHAGARRRRPARPARPTGPTRRCWSGSGSTAMPSGRRSARCRAASVAGCSCC